jgi:hypothetical protein
VLGWQKVVPSSLPPSPPLPPPPPSHHTHTSHPSHANYQPPHRTIFAHRFLWFVFTLRGAVSLYSFAVTQRDSPCLPTRGPQPRRTCASQRPSLSPLSRLTNRPESSHPPGGPIFHQSCPRPAQTPTRLRRTRPLSSAPCQGRRPPDPGTSFVPTSTPCVPRTSGKLGAVGRQSLRLHFSCPPPRRTSNTQGQLAPREYNLWPSTPRRRRPPFPSSLPTFWRLPTTA